MVPPETVRKSWPPGQRPLPRSFLDEHKRERCAFALAEIVRTSGVNNLTVVLITKQAKMSRSTFYDLFENQEEALRFACGLGNQKLQEALESAASEPRAEKESFGDAIGRLVGAVESWPRLAELSLVHGCGYLGPGVGPRDPKLVAALADALALAGPGGREEGRPRRTEEFLAHGILSMIARRLRNDELASLSDLGEQLTQIADAAFLRRPSATIG